MRYLFCLAFCMTTLFSSTMPTKAESPKEDATLIIIASSKSNYEFLVLQASEDSIFWSFKRDNRSQNDKGEFYRKEIQNREGKIAGDAGKLTAAFSMVLNLEKQVQESPQSQDKPTEDYISPYDFAMLLIDSTGIKSCQLSHKQQVELSHCEEMKPIFDVARENVVTDKRVMIQDLLYAGHEYARSLSKPATNTTNTTPQSVFPPVPANVDDLSETPKPKTPIKIGG